MVSISNIIFYVLIFLSVYVQVFFLVTFLENRKKIIIRNGKIKLDFYPSVTIAVPCWNEENTVEKTVHSLLDLNYPKDKVKIILVDDGSKDNTWNIISKFDRYANIKIFRKENGGKYTALNLALKHTQTDFFGGLDADSVADSEALIRIMSYFERDPGIMAVAPSLVVNNPKNIVQSSQKVEYNMGVYLKKMFGFLGAIHVTPGPLAVFRKKVFDDLGPYRFAHNTEDMELAYRMQKNNYKIEQCHDAYVYTNTPSTIKGLYKQRLRWIYGSINNLIDYRNLLFKPKYGNFSFFTLPLIIMTIFTAMYLILRISYSIFDFIYSKILQYSLVGFNLPTKIHFFDPFFIKTRPVLFIGIFIFLSTIFFMIYGKKMVENKWRFPFAIFYYFFISSMLAPLVFFKAIINTILNKKPKWR